MQWGGGGLENAELVDGACNPNSLPSQEDITILIVYNFHRDLKHSSVSQTLTSIRQKMWIPRGRSMLCVLHKCYVCRRFEGGAYKMPQFTPFPLFRITQSAFVSATVLDYLGTVYVKNAGDTCTLYI